jgi:putative copper export protein
MRRIVSLVVVALVMTAMMAASAVPVFAQGAEVIPCSEIFGPDVKGVIVTTPSGHFHFNCKFPD